MVMQARRFGLVTAGLAALTLAGAGLAAAADDPAPITSSASGTQDGWYYQLWRQSGTTSLTLGSAGDYSVTWNVPTDFFAGKGWKPGSRLPVSYTATMAASGLSMLGLYGWTTNPLTEYYVIDNWTTYNPGTNMTRLTSITTDGGVYDVYRSFHPGMVARPDAGAGSRVAPQSIQPNSWYTYWSVRQNRRTSGTISVANHFDAWSKLGMTVGGPWTIRSSRWRRTRARGRRRSRSCRSRSRRRPPRLRSPRRRVQPRARRRRARRPRARRRS